jgi:5-methylcytosine-specific restriction endonuclease McrA
VWHGLAASPLGLAAAAGLVTVAVVSAARQARWKSLPRDPVRRFARADKALILARAGGRCEYHGLLTGRCHVSEGLEADHVHPHRRGGRTDLSNGQALCRRHNRSKHAHVPYVWQLNQLAKHRAEYYPPGGTAHCQPTHPAPATTAPWIA